MRVPLSWLGEWVDLPDAVTLEHVHAALVRVGFEEEDVVLPGVSGPVVVGQVLSAEAEPQSNGKTINWCRVEVGEAEPRGIVCGAHNFGVGDKVVVTLPGAVLPGPFPIAARKTYGHVSDGMIASARELGLGDEHSGILRLAELGLDPVPGADALQLLGLNDAAVDINVTPDRGYALSIRGVAREYSHSTGAAFRDPALAVTVAAATGFPVRIEDAAPIRGRAGCERFVARVVRGIDAARPTPPWLSSRLRLAGIRSISISVDVTNYVMLELGQPIHGYDLAKLDGGLTVRRAAPGETLRTLDGQDRALHPEDLVIADETGAVGVAGVMGGERTELGASTTDVLVEAAVFDPVSIARSARRHKLPSEASRRFERGVDPAVSAAAAQRVVDLLVELAGGTADALGASVGEVSPRAAIELPLDLPSRLVGVDYPVERVVATLREIGAELSVDAHAGRASVVPPSWRPDLTDAPTLVEEVARIAGYAEIPSVLPVAPPGRGLTRAQRRRRAVATALAAAGSVEVLAAPFVSAAQHAAFTPDAPAVRVANPLDGEVGLLRRTLLPGLAQLAHRNLARGLTDLALFELGAVFLPEPGVEYGTAEVPPGAALPSAEVLAALDASIPPQRWHAASLHLGSVTPKQPGAPAVAAELRDAMDAVRVAAEAAGLAHTRIAFRAASRPGLHPGRTAEVLVGERVVGVAAELLPALAAELDLPRTVAVAELDLEALIELGAEPRLPAQLGVFPAATQDLSLIVPVGVVAAEVGTAVREGAGPLLEALSLVDDYRGPGVPDGTKSLTFALRFRAPDRTLTAAEASESKLAGVAVAAERFGAELRA